MPSGMGVLFCLLVVNNWCVRVQCVRHCHIMFLQCRKARHSVSLLVVFGVAVGVCFLLLPWWHPCFFFFLQHSPLSWWHLCFHYAASEACLPSLSLRTVLAFWALSKASFSPSETVIDRCVIDEAPFLLWLLMLSFAAHLPYLDIHPLPPWGDGCCRRWPFLFFADGLSLFCQVFVRGCLRCRVRRQQVEPLVLRRLLYLRRARHPQRELFYIKKKRVQH